MKKRINIERITLLTIGSQHPAWSANSQDNLVRIFNDMTTMARSAVGAKGKTDEDKADWCASELEKNMVPVGLLELHARKT